MSVGQYLVALARPAVLAVALAAASLLTPNEARAQFITQQVGGVSIDARGVVSNVKLDEVNELKRVRQQALQPVAGDLKAKALRKVSLRGLEAAIDEQRKTGAPLSDEMRYLAGLQRVQYVLVYPESGDIVLAGPGEGWKLGADGEVIGLTTNRPVMLLDDLLVALRVIEEVQQTGITCSIDPTPEGVARLQAFVKGISGVDSDIDPIVEAMTRSVGPQTITIGGVPQTSHFARVLLAADYRMKRLGMGFDESGVKGLPSFMQMIKNSGRGTKTLMPRWWLEPDYDALVADVDGLAWELPRGSVKAMTAEKFFAGGGQQKRGAGVNPLAERWAENMTAHYDELSVKDSIFGQLRNCIDLAVVAALISKEHLAEKCGWSMPLLMNAELPVESYHAPQQVDSQATTVQTGSGWLISVSGGVQMAPWQMLEHRTTSPELRATRERSAAPGKSWWWN